MPQIVEGQLQLNFPDNWQVTKLDEWSFYRRQFQNVCGGAKAIDVLAIAPREGFWTIEIKDYRRHPRTKAIDLAQEVAEKVRDTLCALVAARVQANDAEERRLATSALRCPRLRIVLHLEQPAQHSKLFPRAIDPADVLQSLKRLLRAIDPHPLVLETKRMQGVPWTAQSL